MQIYTFKTLPYGTHLTIVDESLVIATFIINNDGIVSRGKELDGIKTSDYFNSRIVNKHRPKLVAIISGLISIEQLSSLIASIWVEPNQHSRKEYFNLVKLSVEEHLSEINPNITILNMKGKI